MRISTPYYERDSQPYNECLLDGKRVHYDACSEDSLDKAKSFYGNYKYIGSSFTTFHNGIENNWKVLNHFFIKK